MDGRPDIGQLDASLAALTIGVHQAAHSRHRDLLDGFAGEVEQQVHVPLSGVASQTPGSIDKSINWELPFVVARAQRQVPFETPHFTHGIEFLEPPPHLVLIHAYLVNWRVSEQRWHTGATVRFSVFALDTTDPVPYSAMAHLSFQGYATSAEGDEFDQ